MLIVYLFRVQMKKIDFETVNMPGENEVKLNATSRGG